MILFTILINILCQRGLSVISWFIVLIPFIMMTIITTILLFIFGLSPSSGKFNYDVYDKHDDHKHGKLYTSENNI